MRVGECGYGLVRNCTLLYGARGKCWAYYSQGDGRKAKWKTGMGLEGGGKRPKIKMGYYPAEA